MSRRPPRRPDYASAYPDDASLAQAIQHRKMLAKELQAGAGHFRALRRTVDGYDPNGKTRVVPSAHGHIDHMLLTIPPSDSHRVAIDPLDARHLRTLIEHLGGEDRSFTVVCHAHQASEVDRWLDQAGVGPCCGELPHRKGCPRQIVRSAFDNSIWAQDGYIALEPLDCESQADTIGRPLVSYDALLCEGVLFNRQEDQTLASDIASQTDTRDLHSNLYFQGGNILATPELAMIGRDYVWKNVGRYHLHDEDEVMTHFDALLGLPAIKLGRAQPMPAQARTVLTGLYQPIFHIDMFVTPTGVIGESGKEIVLFGAPNEYTAEERRRLPDFSFSEYFDPVREQLSEHFEIHPLPLVPQFSKMDGNTWFYHLTWNNAVVENYTHDGEVKRVVYLPTYEQDAKRIGLDPGLRKEFDTEAIRRWRNVGFEVRRLDGQEDLAHSFGAVHCMTKVMRRSHYARNWLASSEEPTSRTDGGGSSSSRSNE